MASNIIDSLPGEVATDQLVDFDWRVKAIFGTSNMVAQPPPPVVEVDFHLCSKSLYDEKSGNVTETLHLEVNSQELKALISSLEKSLAGPSNS